MLVVCWDEVAQPHGSRVQACVLHNATCEAVCMSDRESKPNTNTKLTQKSRQKPLSFLKRIQFVGKFTAL